MEINNEQCVLVGNHFANTMQFVVALVAATVLIGHKIFIEDDLWWLKSRFWRLLTGTPIPKYIEKRTWRTWFMDNTKQVLSSSLAHIYATYIAILFSNNDNANASNGGDPCAWFLIQFLIDTAIGVFLSFGLSKATIFFIGWRDERLVNRWFLVGNYQTQGPKRVYTVWVVQVVHWVFCSLVARMCCSLFMYATLPLWVLFADSFSQTWEHHRHAELIFVVLGMPILMNSVQFLLTNWYLRWRRPKINNDQLTQSLNNLDQNTI